MGRTYFKLPEGRRLYLNSPAGWLLAIVLLVWSFIALLAWPFRAANRRIHHNLEKRAESRTAGPKSAVGKTASSWHWVPPRPGFVAKAVLIWVAAWLVLAFTMETLDYSDDIAAWFGAVGAIVLPLWGICRAIQLSGRA